MPSIFNYVNGSDTFNTGKGIILRGAIKAQNYSTTYSASRSKETTTNDMTNRVAMINRGKV